MNATERKAALKALNTEVGQRAREITDLIHTAMSEGVFTEDLPVQLRRCLSVCQVAAQELAPASAD